MSKQPLIPDAGFVPIDGTIMTTPTYAGLDIDFLSGLKVNPEVTIPATRDGKPYTQDQIEYMEWQLEHNANLKSLTLEGSPLDNDGQFGQLIRAAGTNHNLKNIVLDDVTKDIAKAIVDAGQNTLTSWDFKNIGVPQAAILAEGIPGLMAEAKFRFNDVKPDQIANLATIAETMKGTKGAITLTHTELDDAAKKTLRQYKDNIQGVDLDTPAEKLIARAATARDIVISQATIGKDGFSAGDVQKLAKALNKNTNLHSLEINGVPLTDAELADLINTGKKEQFENLSVKGIGVSGKSAEAIAGTLSNNPGMKKLTLLENAIGPDEMQIIAPAVKGSALSSLDLTGNPTIGNEGVKALADNVTEKTGSPTGLQVDLSGAGITDAGIDNTVRLAATLNTDKNRPKSKINLEGNIFSKDKLAAFTPVKDYIDGIVIPEAAAPAPPPPERPAAEPAQVLTTAAPVEHPSPEPRAEARRTTATRQAHRANHEARRHHRLDPKTAHNKNYHHQSVAHSESGTASPKDHMASGTDEQEKKLADNAIGSLKNYLGPNDQALPGPIMVYDTHKIIPGNSGQNRIAKIKPPSSV